MQREKILDVAEKNETNFKDHIWPLRGLRNFRKNIKQTKPSAPWLSSPDLKSGMLIQCNWLMSNFKQKLYLIQASLNKTSQYGRALKIRGSFNKMCLGTNCFGIFSHEYKSRRQKYTNKTQCPTTQINRLKFIAQKILKLLTLEVLELYNMPWNFY